MSRSTPTLSSVPISLVEQFNLLKTRNDVANLLNISDKGLRHLLYVLPNDSLYRIFEIKKKTGGLRKITAPHPRLKAVQQRLLRILFDLYSPRDSTHGFVINRSICTNAKTHIRSKFVLNIDLEDFFPSINFGRVRGLFLAAPYRCPHEVATVLAQICCYKNQLPQGSPVSPIISNMICARLDSHLHKLARKYHCYYSRYADDITFSTNKAVFPSEIAKLVDSDGKTVCKLGNSLLNTIYHNGFKVNQAKTRMQKYDERQVVTGLITNKKINVSREFIRDIRAMLHNWEKDGIAKCQLLFEARYLVANSLYPKQKLFKEMVRGKIDFVGTVRGKDDPIYLKLLQKLADLDRSILSSRTLHRLKEINNRNDFVLDNLWIIETTSADEKGYKQGTAFYLDRIGLVTCEHVLLDGDTCLVEIYHRDNSERQFAGIVKKDRNLDLAILSLKQCPEYMPEISHDEPQIGERIWLAGFPNFGPKSSGIIQSGEIIGRKTDVYGNLRFAINAHIMEGNSGGPIFNSEWKVIGIAVKGIRGQYDLENASFFEFIPISQLTNLLR